MYYSFAELGIDSFFLVPIIDSLIVGFFRPIVNSPMVFLSYWSNCSPKVYRIMSKCWYTSNIREASNSKVVNNSRDATTTGMPISAGTVRNVGSASPR
jgi:hypothetical protein